MELHLDNILKIRDARIALNGLTVITGENDSGKSTIGKVLFTVLKTINNTSRYNKDTAKSRIKSRLLHIAHTVEINRPDGYPKGSVGWLKENIADIASDLVEGTIDIETIEKDILVPLDADSFSPRTKAMVRSDFARIREIIERVNDPAKATLREFQSICDTEFGDQLLSYDATSGNISLGTPNSGDSRLDIHIGKDSLTVDPTEANFFNDVTYVESPLFLNILNQISLSTSYLPMSLRYDNRRNRMLMPLHLTDFANKMSATPDSTHSSLFQSSPQLIDSIGNLINGQFASNPDGDELIFLRDNHKIKLGNVASGIKTFGVVQSLLRSGVISPENLLIWDEPENHLHPRWQVEFAQLLVQLVAEGIPVVISTHSPYFVQGIRYHAARYKVEDVVNYFMAEEREDGYSDFVEVTDDLNRVFVKLASPLNEIMNVDEARKETIQ
ncbi:MAG: AAA family ATPase [Muribaculaceae bacterium]